MPSRGISGLRSRITSTKSDPEIKRNILLSKINIPSFLKNDEKYKVSIAEYYTLFLSKTSKENKLYSSSLTNELFEDVIDFILTDNELSKLKFPESLLTERIESEKFRINSEIDRKKIDAFDRVLKTNRLLKEYIEERAIPIAEYLNPDDMEYFLSCITK
jgi:hypothetical protein